LNLLGHIPAFFNDLSPCENKAEALRELGRLYNGAVEDLNVAFEAYAKTGETMTGPSPTYPYLLLRIGKRYAGNVKFSGFVSIRGAGWYGTTITSPDIFESYLLDQLERVENAHEVEYYVGPSDTKIPLVLRRYGQIIPCSACGIIQGPNPAVSKNLLSLRTTSVT